MYRNGQKSLSYVGYVNSPPGPEARSRNIGQTFLDISVHVQLNRGWYEFLIEISPPTAFATKRLTKNANSGLDKSVLSRTFREFARPNFYRNLRNFSPDSDGGGGMGSGSNSFAVAILHFTTNQFPHLIHFLSPVPNPNQVWNSDAPPEVCFIKIRPSPPIV